MRQPDPVQPTVPAIKETAIQGSQAAWERALAAGRAEGTVSVVTHPSLQWRGWVPIFQQRFPEIKVEHLGMRPSEVTPRIISEQRNGLFNFDVMVGPTSNSVKNLSPAGVFQDLRPFMLSPEAVDNAKWHGGLEMWADKDATYSLVTAMTVTRATIVNRRMIPRGELTTIDGLLDPKYKGRIVIYDPRETNNGSLQLASVLQNRSEDFLRQVLQDAVFVDSPSQLVDFVVSGRYPIGIGSDPERLEKLQAEGLAQDVEVTTLSAHAAASGIAVFQNAPHPNAAAILVNWFLSQEGQEAYAREGETATRRTDASSYIGDSQSYGTPEWGNLDQYVRANEWQGIPLVDRVSEIAKEIRR